MTKIGEVVQELEHGLDVARGRVDHARVELQEKMDQTKERIETAWYDTVHAIRKHPVRMVAAAAAAGLLMGMLLGRRRGGNSRIA